MSGELNGSLELFFEDSFTLPHQSRPNCLQEIEESFKPKVFRDTMYK